MYQLPLTFCVSDATLLATSPQFAQAGIRCAWQIVQTNALYYGNQHGASPYCSHDKFSYMLLRIVGTLCIVDACYSRTHPQASCLRSVEVCRSLGRLVWSGLILANAGAGATQGLAIRAVTSTLFGRTNKNLGHHCPTQLG